VLTHRSPPGRLGRRPPTVEQLAAARPQFCYESYAAGNGYVGPTAAADTPYVAKLLDKLVRDWRDGRTGLIDD